MSDPLVRPFRPRAHSRQPQKRPSSRSTTALPKGPLGREDRLLTEKEAAKVLRISVRTLQGWRVDGGGPKFLKIGRSVRYRLSALRDYIYNAERRSTSDPGPAA